ncbi:uncharacterized protein LOC134824691 isoform X1 [Bolinopsis microptera]|uniref:uncharacterized protein LOC134824691 isoform X1 n=1 Tax=Bolinopsis microptera TaxID=2820187 RepID=UPI003079D1C1
MKVFVILIGVFSSVSAEVMKCNGADGATAEDCEDGVVACTSPVWSRQWSQWSQYYVGASAQAYGCGECPADSTATCAQCVATADAGCNVDVTPAEAIKFECYDYSLVKEALVASKTATICHAEKATAIACNKPGSAAVAKTYNVANKGCGPCTEVAKKDKRCFHCFTDKCNSASTLAFVLAPLLAVFFHMM